MLKTTNYELCNNTRNSLSYKRFSFNAGIVGSDVIEYGFQFLQAIRSYQACTEVFDVRQALKIVGIVAAHFKDTEFFALPLNGTQQVAAAGVEAFGQGRGRQGFTRGQEVLDLPEYPRVPDGGTAYHNAINPIAVLVLQCLLRTIDITVAKYRYLDARVFFHLGYQPPVGFAFVHLYTGSAMNGKRLYAHILQTFGNFLDVPGTIVPAQPRFDRNRQFGRPNHCFCKAHHQVDILQYPGSGAFA
ncbi:MAG: hypothetical protein K0R82_1538 [Flavipsychrobacter sp.]|nr:hypothetical protein [Flavipsychrobacter sp.]